MAFVVLNNTYECSMITEIYRKYFTLEKYWKWTWKRVFCNCYWKIEEIMQDKHKLEGKYCIKVKKADHPDNIKWENVILKNLVR